MNCVRRLWLSGPLSRLMSRVLTRGKRSLTVSYQSTKRSTRQSLVTFDVTAYRKSSSEAGRKRPDFRHGRHCFKVMVGSLGGNTTLASPGEGTDLDRGLGIHRDPQCEGIGIRLLVVPLHLGKDGVGLRKFFWGWLLATFFG